MARILEVPLATDGEVLTVDLEEDLPEDPSEICVLLENENAPAKYWLAFAAAYVRSHHPESASEVIQRGQATPAAAKDDGAGLFASYTAWLLISDLRNAPAPEKPNAYAQAVEAGNRAYAATEGSIPALLARGALTLAAGNFKDSQAPLQAVLKQDPSNIWALLGKARSLYHKKNYRPALRIYQDMLRRRPDLWESGCDPRLGIGLCFWRLGDPLHAAAAFRRSLQLKETANAHAMLGTLQLDAVLHNPPVGAAFDAAYGEALGHLRRAWELDRSPLAAVGLASYFFVHGDYEKVRRISTAALESSSWAPIREEALFWLARAAHIEGDDTAAIEYYGLAGTEGAALLGKAQVEHRMGVTAAAKSTLDALISREPRSLPALFYAGALISSSDGDSAPMLEKYVALGGERPEARIMLAQLFEKRDPSKALGYLREVVIDSANLLVNLAGLEFAAGSYEQALESLNKAGTAPGAETCMVTIEYNTARVLEASGELEKARDAYKSMEGSYPDAAARSLFLRSVSGEDVITELQDLVEATPKNLEYRTLLGWVLRRERAGKRADERETENWRKILVDVDRHDSYALVALGNIYSSNAREHRVTSDADAERRDRSYARATELYTKALALDGQNAYAAQGLGIVLAETGRLDDALSVFVRVREAMADSAGSAPAAINAGHVLMELKRYSRAAELYELALTKIPAAESGGVLSLLGRAWYAFGSSNKDPAALEKSIEYAKRAEALSPDTAALRFNVCFAQFTLADTIRRLPANKQTLARVERALEWLGEAIKSLRSLATLEKPPYPASDLEERAELAEATIQDALTQARDERTRHETDASHKLKAAKARLEEEEQARELERKRKREALEQREKALAEERLRLQEQTREWEEEREAAAAAAANERDQEPDRKRRKGSKKRRSKEDDDFIEEDDDGQGADTPPPSPPSSSTSPKPDLEEEKPEEPVKRNTIVDDDGDDDDEGLF